MIPMSAPPTPRRPAPTEPGPGRDPAPVTGALRGLHVLVVAVDSASDATAPYTAAIAEHLATVAGGVTLLTGVPPCAGGGRPAAYAGLRTADPGWLAPDRGARVIRLRGYTPRGARPGTAREALRELSVLLNAASAGHGLPVDLVVGITPGPGGAAAAAWIARRHRVPLVTLVRSTVEEGGLPGALERYALRHSAQVAVTADSVRDRLPAGTPGPERLHLLPTWARTAAAAPGAAAARRELGWEQDRFLAVHLGPLDHRLDGVTLVEAARALGTAPGVAPQVVLVGDGPARAGLEQRAFGLPGVRFTDPPADDLLPLVLAAADVLLVAEAGPAGSATASGQLAGYLAAGRAVVAVTGAIGPTAGELRRSGAGVQVDRGDAAGLAAALLDLRDVPGRRAALGRSARRYARAQLGRGAALRRLDAVVEAALTGGC